MRTKKEKQQKRKKRLKNEKKSRNKKCVFWVRGSVMILSSKTIEFYKKMQQFQRFYNPFGVVLMLAIFLGCEGGGEGAGLIITQHIYCLFGLW